MGMLLAGTITFTVTDGVATFDLVGASGWLRAGDTLVATTPQSGVFEGPAWFEAIPCVLMFGVVDSVSNDTVTVKQVGSHWAEGSSTQYLVVYYLARAHKPSTGSWTQGSTLVTGVANVGTWDLGQRIRSAGIDEGTFIVAVDAGNSTITLSRAASNTGTGRLFDADMRRILTNEV